MFNEKLDGKKKKEREGEGEKEREKPPSLL